MAKTVEEIQAKLDSFNKAYKKNGWTDGKISWLAAREVANKAGIYKQNEQYYQNRIQRYGSTTGQMNTPEARSRKSHKMKKPVLQYTKENIFIKEWMGALDVKNTLGINAGDVCTCCKGKLKSAGGFIWKYKSEQ